MATPYIGRFAPSPTGPLHFGSLVAALASYLDARYHQGQWLVRIEDLDPPRQPAGAAQLILSTLEQHGLEWDAEVRFQGQRSGSYQAALELLQQQEVVFACQCSRRQLNRRPHYGGFSQACCANDDPSVAWRLTGQSREIHWHDRIQGPQIETTAAEDIVLRRRDGLWAYQLAVVIDDADQQISHIVRGLDLLPLTRYQRQLQEQLSLPKPHMAHLPLALEANGQKLSKQNHAIGVHQLDPKQNLLQALTWLKQDTRAYQEQIAQLTIAEILKEAVRHWDIQRLENQQQSLAPQAFQHNGQKPSNTSPQR